MLSDDIFFIKLGCTGDLQIGRITFDMFFSINYSDLRPHIRELADSIAQELDVNTSQVRKKFFAMLEYL